MFICVYTCTYNTYGFFFLMVHFPHISLLKEETFSVCLLHICIPQHIEGSQKINIKSINQPINQQL